MEMNSNLFPRWFLLDDDKPLLTQIMVVRKPIYKNWWLDFQGKCDILSLIGSILLMKEIQQLISGMYQKTYLVYIYPVWCSLHTSTGQARFLPSTGERLIVSDSTSRLHLGHKTAQSVGMHS